MKEEFIQNKIKINESLCAHQQAFSLSGDELIQLKKNTNVWRTNNFTKLTINET